MKTSKAEAVWNGNLQQGNGTMRLGSGMFEGKYTFASRFESGNGTNPEELIGAAHAGCFSMAFGNELNKAGFPPKRIDTKATVTLDTVNGSPTITHIDLDTTGEVPNIDEQKFQEIAEAAKKGCPVSRALSGVKEINLKAKLVG